MSTTTRRRYSSRNVFAAAGLAALVALTASIVVPMSARADPLTIAGTVSLPSGSLAAGLSVTIAKELSGNFSDVASVKTSSSGGFSFTGLATGLYSVHFPATATSFEQYLGGESSQAASALAEVDTTPAPATTFVNVVLAAGGTITGKVAKPSGTGLKSFRVRAFAETDDKVWTLKASTTTSISGTYTLTGLEPGAYRLEAVDTAATSSYLPIYSGGGSLASAATTVGVVASKKTTYNFSIPTSATIKGTVTGIHDATIVENLAGVVVTPYLLSGPVGSWTDATLASAKAVTTNAAGAYVLGGLAPGSYALEFRPRATAPLPASGILYGRSFLGGTNTAIGSTWVTVTTGAVVTGKNVQLVPGATVSGEVTDAATTPIPHLRITIEHSGSPADEPRTGAQTTTTDNVGHFSFVGLGAGPYTLAIGSNSDSDSSDGVNEDTTWKRTVLALPNGDLAAGEDRVEQLVVAKKDPLGLHPSGTLPVVVTVGPLVVGSVISADPGNWNGDLTSHFRYQWLRNGVAIADATDQQYTVAPGDYQYVLSARVTLYDFEYGSGSYTTPTTDPVGKGTIQPGAAPTVTGGLVVGQTLSANTGTWSVPGVAFTYQWQFSGDGGSVWTDTPPYESLPTHLVSATDLLNGPLLRVRLVGARFGYQSVSADVVAGSAIQGTQSILALPSVTQTTSSYTVHDGTWLPASGTSGFTWTVIDPDGTTTTTYGTTLPRAGTEGKKIVLSVTHAKGGYAPLSAPEILVQAGAPLATTELLPIGGSATVGGTLTAPSPTWLPAADGTNYQWQYQSAGIWKNIAGATSSNYVPAAGDLGRALRVQLKPYAAGWTTPTVAAQPTTAVAIGAPSALSGLGGEQPMITGTVGINRTVSVSPGVWTPTPSTFSYQWKTSTDGVAFTPVPGGTAAAVTVPESALNAELYVDITAATPGRASATHTVNVAQVVGGLFRQVTAPKVTKSGTVLAVTTGTWSPTPSSFAYQWYMYADNGALAPISTTSSVDPFAAGAIGRRIVVSVTAKGPGASDTSTQAIAAQTGTLAPSAAAAPTAPSVAVDSVFTAPAVTWSNLTSPQRAYTWQYKSGSSYTTIAGQSAATFTPGPKYAGRQLRVIETATASGYSQGKATSLPTTALAPGAAPTPGTGVETPIISGPATLSGTLTVNPRTWSRSGGIFSYEWQVSADGTTNWSTIAGATHASYRVSTTLLGKHLRVIITDSIPGYLPGVTTILQPGAIGMGNLQPTQPAKVTVKSGRYTVTSSWNVTPTSLHYDWKVYNQATDQFELKQSSATGSFTPSSADRAKAIQVDISPDRPNFNSITVTVVIHKGPKVVPLSPLTVTGDPVVGQLLTAVPPVDGWSTTNLALDYQWKRSGTAIAGATNSSYTAVTADVGKALTVEFKPSATGFAAAKYSVAAGVVNSDVLPTATVKPSTSGTYEVDRVLTATPGTWSMTGLTFHYQWMRMGVPIPGATRTTYLLAPTELLKEISIRVTATRPFFPSGVASSDAVTVFEGEFIDAVPATLPAEVKLDTEIKPILHPWNWPATVFYQWSYNDGSGWTMILGANSPTYTPTNADNIKVGYGIRAAASAYRPGHPTGGWHSDTVVVQ
ncbi:MAG: hypothetical protein JWR53_1333 [Glaciihabitans sp.]|nr:hypothetical protein [Glaciihabitans sp.]